jgi:quinol monooxygenase YgiN
MEQIQVSATFPSISPDGADEFKQLAAEALATIRGEPDTLQHDWFFSDDGSKCVVRETYVNSNAFLVHLAASGPLLGRLVELGGGLELEVPAPHPWRWWRYGEGFEPGGPTAAVGAGGRGG